MDRRLAAVAGLILAGIGTAGAFSRRGAPQSSRTGQDLQLDDDAEAADGERDIPLGGLRAPLGEVHAIDIPQASHGACDEDPTGDDAQQPVPPSLAELLLNLVDDYPLGIDKRLVLRDALRRLCPRIEAGELEGGTVLVDFVHEPGAGIVIEMALILSVSKTYARITVCDMQQQLHAPEIDVHISNGEARAVLAPSIQVDLEGFRSEAGVTYLKLQAIENGMKIHPGNAIATVSRLCTTHSPFDGRGS